MKGRYYVYFMASKSRKALYIGVTNDLYRRVLEHKKCNTPGFTQRYCCSYLVYYEEYSSIVEAINRETILKKWSRKKKEELFIKDNPEYKDLAEDWY